MMSRAGSEVVASSMRRVRTAWAPRRRMVVWSWRWVYDGGEDVSGAEAFQRRRL